MQRFGRGTCHMERHTGIVRQGYLANSGRCFTHLQPSGSCHRAKKYQANVKRLFQDTPICIQHTLNRLIDTHDFSFLVYSLSVCLSVCLLVSIFFCMKEMSVKFKIGKTVVNNFLSKPTVSKGNSSVTMFKMHIWS